MPSVRQVYQLLRSPTSPGPFPARIVSGLDSSDVASQREALLELQAFIRGFFYLKFHGPFFVQQLVTAGIVGLLILIGLVVIYHRIYHKRFQAFRCEPRAQGIYVIPNAINCFLIFEGIYAVIMIGFNFVVWKAYSHEEASNVRQIPTWRLLVWIPLYVGAFFTGWGSFYTAPGALDRPSASRSKFSAKGALPWPTIVNIACLGTPFVLIASLIPNAVLASRQFGSAFTAFEHWTNEVDALLAQDPASLIANSATEAIISQARSVWQSCSMAIWYIDIGFTLWSCWALFFLFFYIPAGGVLVFLLLRQVLHQKAAMLSYQRKLEEQLAKQDQDRLLSQTPRLNKFDDGQQGVGGSESPAHLKSPQSAGSLATYKSSESANPRRGNLGLMAALDELTPGSHDLGMGDRSVNGNADTPLAALPTFSAIEQQQKSVTPSSNSKLSSFLRKAWPSHKTASEKTMMSRKAKELRRRSTGSTPMIRYQYLRRSLVNLMILYFGIIAAACLFLVCTMRLAIGEYEASLRDPDALADELNVSATLAAWATAIFGGLTLGSIIFRDFDQTPPEFAEDSIDAAPKRRFFQRRNDKDPEAAAEKQAHPPQDIRTLPAVPESVGVETSMMSFLGTRPGRASQAGLRLLDPTLTGQLGPFVLDQQERSNIRRPSAVEGDHAEGSRHFLRAVREPTASLPQDELESYGPTGYTSPITRPRELSDPASHSHANPDSALVSDAIAHDQVGANDSTPASTLAREWTLSQSVPIALPDVPIAATTASSPDASAYF